MIVDMTTYQTDEWKYSFSNGKHNEAIIMSGIQDVRAVSVTEETKGQVSFLTNQLGIHDISTQRLLQRIHNGHV